MPFCVKKCNYCDFVSFSGKEARFLEYKDAVIKEILATDFAGREVNTIFIGGGTPSVVPPCFVEEILYALRANPFAKDIEITMEANPATLSYENLVKYKEMGINRLSIGLQASQDRILKFLGRAHSFVDFLENYQAAREVGFKNINVDLMFAVPTQTKEEWVETVATIAKLNPEHISAYSLIIEDGTKFGRLFDSGEFQVIPDDTDREMYSVCCEILKQYGYNRYEISNFAKSTFASRHNIKYWRRAEYLGFGVAAHSLVGDVRFENASDFNEYMSDSLKKENVQVSRSDAMAEYMFLGLRMTSGISIQEFNKKFGDINQIYGSVIEKHLKNGMLVKERGRIFLSDRGIDVSNIVMADFL